MYNVLKLLFNTTNFAELSITVSDNSAKLIVLNNNFRTLYNKLLEIHEELTGLITFDNW